MKASGGLAKKPALGRGLRRGCCARNPRGSKHGTQTPQFPEEGSGGRHLDPWSKDRQKKKNLVESCSTGRR